MGLDLSSLSQKLYGLEVDSVFLLGLRRHRLLKHDIHEDLLNGAIPLGMAHKLGDRYVWIGLVRRLKRHAALLHVKSDSAYELFRPEPVKQWDFAALPQAQWDWLFSKAAQGSTPDGALCPEVPGKMVNLSLSGETINADAVEGLRIECAWKAPDGSCQPPAMVDITWTAQVPGVKASESVPFYGPVKLINPDPNRPGIFVINLEDIPQWAGILSALNLGITLPTAPPEAPTPIQAPLAVRSISLYTY